MKNKDIIELIYASENSKDIIRVSKIYNNRLKNGINSFMGIEQYKDILTLLINLSNEKYQITNKDMETLKKYNIVIQTTKQKPNNNDMIKNNHPNKPDLPKVPDKKFVVVSDFHSYRYPLDKIKNKYLKEYDCIYILGDATDRGKDNNGTGGVQLLIDIMKLSKQYPGRVMYIPGNHDEFLLGYIRSKYKMDSYYPYDYVTNLFRNGGEQTIYDLKKLEQQDPKTLQELITWLGRQPLQRTHRYNGREYVLGHAIFNQKLYNINPNYCLEDYFKESQYSENRRMAKDVIWFRKEKDAFNPYEMPSADKIMVIGHTPEIYNRGKNIDLIDAYERPIKVHCVDGGIAYNGGMLKYDGAQSVMWTTYLPNIGSPTIPNQQPQKHNVDSETILKSHILAKTLNEGRSGIEKLIQGNNPKELSKEECAKIIRKGILSSTIKSEIERRNIYVKTVLVDYIIENQLKRMREQIPDENYSVYEATQMLETFVYGTTDKNYIQKNGNNGKGNLLHITSKNHARAIAQIIGSQTMMEVIYFHGYKNVDEYIYNKFIKNNRNQINNQQRAY